MRIGTYITYNGKEWLVTAKGDWGVRCERGCGRELSVIVLPWEHFTR